MDLISYAVFGLVCAWVGYHVKAILFRLTISEDPDKIIKILEDIKRINNETGSETTTGTKVEVEPEHVNSVWYAYSKETGQFLAQGPTLEEALRLASLRFPNKTFWCETLESNLTKQA